MRRQLRPLGVLVSMLVFATVNSMASKAIGWGGRARGWVLGCAMLGGVGCGDPLGEESPSSSEPLDDGCGDMLEIDTSTVSVVRSVSPSESQMAKDALDPSSANLAEYGAIVRAEQEFANLLNRPIVIEEANTTLTPEGSEESYEARYELDAPLELDAYESLTVSFDVSVMANDASPSFVLLLLAGETGATAAPTVIATIPGTDNCGHPDGIVVRGADGTVEVERPTEANPLVLEILGTLLKIGS